MQQKIDKLLKILRKRYVEEEKITCLEGEFMAYDGNNRVGSPKVNMSLPSSNIQDEGFHYDEKADTLCVWGRGIGLVYKQGYWAAKKGEDGPQYIPIIFNSPEIY